MRSPDTIAVDPQRVTVEAIEQRYLLVNESDKLAALTRLLEVEEASRVLIFSRTKVGTAQLAEALALRASRSRRSTGPSQIARERVMARSSRGADPPARGH